MAAAQQQQQQQQQHPRRVVISRHAEREDHMRNEWGRAAKRAHDPPLSANGHRQSALMGEVIRGQLSLPEEEVLLYSSPFVRCVQTTTGMSSALYAGSGVGPPLLRIEDFLSERGKNIHTRMMGTHAQMKGLDINPERIPAHPVALGPSDLFCINPNIDERYRSVANITYDSDGRQVPWEVEERLENWLDGFLTQKGHAGKTLLCSTHGGVAVSIVERLTQTRLRWKAAYAQTYILEYNAAEGKYDLVFEWHPEDAQLSPRDKEKE